MKKYNILFYSFLLILLLLFIFFKYVCLLNKPEYKIVITLLLFSVYFCIVLLLNKNIKINLIIILLAGLIIRFLFFDNNLTEFSGDANRYIWDGRIQVQGINPYLYSPDSKKLKSFQDGIIYPGINHKDYKTIYPPLSQIIFYISYLAGGDSFYSLKFIYFFFEILTLIFLILLIKDKRYILIYFLCPLIILETYLGM